MDVHILIAERGRVAEQFRSTLTCLGILRAQLIGCLTDEGRHHLLSALDAEAEVCRELGDKLLQLDASIVTIQNREVATSNGSSSLSEPGSRQRDCDLGPRDAR